MPQRAKLLYTLQQIDLQLALKKRRYQEVEASLGENDALREARAALQEAKQAHSHWRATLQDRELQVASVTEKLSTDEERLYSGRITNPRELDDLQKDTEYLNRRKADLEDKQLEAMMALDQADNRLEVANEAFVAVEASWKVENAELAQEYEALKQELSHLLAQRKAVVQHISKRDLNEYSAIRRLRKGIAVASVQNGMCKACNVQVPQRDLERAEKTDDLYYCSGCERILYVPNGT
jgi:predicted  nucleic acid-binding Zn-ribbon protein